MKRHSDILLAAICVYGCQGQELNPEEPPETPAVMVMMRGPDGRPMASRMIPRFAAANRSAEQASVPVFQTPLAEKPFAKPKSFPEAMTLRPTAQGPHTVKATIRIFGPARTATAAPPSVRAPIGVPEGHTVETEVLNFEFGSGSATPLVFMFGNIFGLTPPPRLVIDPLTAEIPLLSGGVFNRATGRWDWTVRYARDEAVNPRLVCGTVFIDAGATDASAHVLAQNWDQVSFGRLFGNVFFRSMSPPRACRYVESGTGHRLTVLGYGIYSQPEPMFVPPVGAGARSSPRTVDVGFTLVDLTQAGHLCFQTEGAIAEVVLDGQSIGWNEMAGNSHEQCFWICRSVEHSFFWRGVPGMSGPDERFVFTIDPERSWPTGGTCDANPQVFPCNTIWWRANYTPL